MPRSSCSQAAIDLEEDRHVDLAPTSHLAGRPAIAIGLVTDGFILSLDGLVGIEGALEQVADRPRITGGADDDIGVADAHDVAIVNRRQLAQGLAIEGAAVARPEIAYREAIVQGVKCDVATRALGIR